MKVDVMEMENLKLKQKVEMLAEENKQLRLQIKSIDDRQTSKDLEVQKTNHSIKLIRKDQGKIIELLQTILELTLKDDTVSNLLNDVALAVVNLPVDVVPPPPMQEVVEAADNKPKAQADLGDNKPEAQAEKGGKQSEAQANLGLKQPEAQAVEGGKQPEAPADEGVTAGKKQPEQPIETRLRPRSKTQHPAKPRTVKKQSNKKLPTEKLPYSTVQTTSEQNYMNALWKRPADEDDIYISTTGEYTIRV